MSLDQNSTLPQGHKLHNPVRREGMQHRWDYLSRAGFFEVKRREGVDWREFAIPNIPWMLMTGGSVSFGEWCSLCGSPKVDLRHPGRP